MTFDFRSFFTALKLSYRDLPQTAGRRIFIILSFLIIYPPFLIINRIGFLLDLIFYRGYRYQKIEMPLHIMGNPRSGTTFLFNLFCLDETNFTYFSFYDIFFPSITLRKIFSFLAMIDTFFGGWLKLAIIKFDQWVFHGVKDIHPTGIFKPEEDIMLFFHTFLSPLFLLIFPFYKEIPALGTFLDRFPQAEREKYMRFYKKALQAQIYKSGGQKQLLSKNVYFQGSIQTLIDTFPDMKILYIVRNPYEAIASFQSLLYAFSRFFKPEISKNSPEIAEAADIGREYYAFAYKTIQKLSPKSVMIVTYDEITKDPKQVVEQVYTWMGREMEPAFVARLDEKLAKSRNYKSRHTYSPEEFGTSEEVIYHQLSEVFQRYGFARSFSSKSPQLF
jgi:hypothetical protein